MSRRKGAASANAAGEEKEGTEKASFAGEQQTFFLRRVQSKAIKAQANMHFRKRGEKSTLILVLIVVFFVLCHCYRSVRHA